MNRTRYDMIIDRVTRERRDLHIAKSDDYATLDVLSNFKRVSAAARALEVDAATPLGYALFMMLMKIDRINNLNGRTPKNESLKDSFKDLMNYAELAFAIYQEDRDVCS